MLRELPCASVILFLGLVPQLTMASYLQRDVRAESVRMPRTWLTVRQALELAHRQTGLKYAVVPSKFEGLVGPFAPGSVVRLERLLRQIAQSAGTTLRVTERAVVFEPSSQPQIEPTPAPDARQHVLRLALSPHSSTIPLLCKYLAHDD
ncbi:MAG: hypothetical protein N2255_02940, partial [Kiritimatiellae bacterium]|nr:hypothetical protein [Kiritimatiellia bacterium]